VEKSLRLVAAFGFCTVIHAQVTLHGTGVETYGGISGNGVQTVLLLTAKGGYKVSYEKPSFRSKFTSTICRDIGAIWTVTARLQDNKRGELLFAECDGSVDPQIHEPQQIVRLYLDHLSMFRHKEAAKLVTPRLAKSGSKFMWSESMIMDMSAKDLRSLIVGSWWFSSRPVQDSRLHTIVCTVPGAFIEINSERRKLVFGLKRTSESAPWLIDSLEIDYE
jgi:hypothetical protein